MTRCYVLTGATSGLGLKAAGILAEQDPAAQIFVGARRPDEADALRRALPGPRSWVSRLDTSSLDSVGTFASALLQELGGRIISGLALNAGLQIVSAKQTSIDGFEMTFATNVLGHIALFSKLQPALHAQSIVVSTASGTHDDSHKLATSHGFRGGFFPSAALVAAGDISPEGNDAQRGLDRYATSKLCNVMFTYAMARRLGRDGPRFIALDPGLMPGTELARDRPAAIQFAWKNVLPTLTKFSEGVSSPARSGQVLADLLSGKEAATGTGLHIEFTRRAIPSSRLSYDTARQDELVDFCEEQISRVGANR